MSERTGWVLLVSGVLWIATTTAGLVVVVGWPEVHLPLSTGYSAGLFFAGLAGICGPLALAVARRARRSRSPRVARGARGPVAAPRRDGGRGSATTHTLSAPSPAAAPSGGGFRVGQAPLPPGPGRPVQSVRPGQGVGASPGRRVAGSALVRGVEPATHPTPARAVPRAPALTSRSPAAAVAGVTDAALLRGHQPGRVYTSGGGGEARRRLTPQTWTARDAEASSIAGLNEITNC